MFWRTFVTLLTVYSIVASGKLSFEKWKKNTAQHTLELLVVVDQSAYTKWYSKMTGDTPDARKQTTLKAILDHYSSVVHDVDAIFSTAKSRGLKLSVKPVAIQIKTSDGIVTSNNNEVDAAKALKKFYDWTRSDIELPKFDHAVLVTGLDMVTKTDKTKSGRAYMGTICSKWSVSIIENGFSHDVVDIMTHELGHSLGVKKHDGKGNKCSPKAEYVMAAVIHINSTHRWEFSKCSVDFIKLKLYHLSKTGKQCMLNKPQGVGSSVSLGKLYTPDKHCTLMEGAGSYFCRQFYPDAKMYSQICRRIYCHMPETKYMCRQFKGSEEVACGNKKVCIRGKCAYRKNAKSVPDDCPQGDQLGEIWNKMTCQQMVAQKSFMCYDQYLRRRCCNSCGSIKTGDPGCQYGDKSPWCQKKLKPPMGCNWNNKLCCGTCKAHKDLKNPNCPYGDKRTWCKKYIKGGYYCYKNHKLCCGSCQKYYNPSNKACPYGDKSTWCKTKLKPITQCKYNLKLCCETCGAKKKWYG